MIRARKKRKYFLGLDCRASGRLQSACKAGIIAQRRLEDGRSLPLPVAVEPDLWPERSVVGRSTRVSTGARRTLLEGPPAPARQLLSGRLYLSPESIKTPDAIDGRSDLYALGAVGYYLLTGEHVFEGATVMEVCLKHLDAVPIPPSQRLGAPVAPLVERLVLDCLAKDAAKRPQTALELQERLRETGAPLWDATRAREWWMTHGQTLRSRRSVSQPISGSARTLAIDHELRS